ncbi:MAG: hypothetical protein HC811_03200 [Flammeovirgaceae bacterium]|nr:hypothetical protein [Flammeovirgaceae bacterium]
MEKLRSFTNCLSLSTFFLITSIKRSMLFFLALENPEGKDKQQNVGEKSAFIKNDVLP